MPEGVVHKYFCEEVAGLGLSLAARGLLVHLMEFADCKGRAALDRSPLYDTNLLWKLTLCETDESCHRRMNDTARMSSYFNELRRVREVIDYQVDGKSYILIPRVVTNHVHGCKRQFSSLIPAPDREMLERFFEDGEFVNELIDSNVWRGGVPVEQHEADKVKEREVGETALRLFEYWKSIMGKRSVVKMTGAVGARRCTAVRRMLEAGYTEDDLRLAIDGCSLSEWHMGDNPTKTLYNDMTVIFRDRDRVARMIRLALRDEKEKETPFDDAVGQEGARRGG